MSWNFLAQRFAHVWLFAWVVPNLRGFEGGRCLWKTAAWSQCVSTRLCSQYAGGTLGYNTAYYLHSTFVFKVYTILYGTSTWATTLPTIFQSLQAVLRTPAFMQQHSVKHKFWNVCRMVSRLQHNSFFFSDLKLTPLLSTQCTRCSVGWRTGTIKFCWTNFFCSQYPGWTAGYQTTGSCKTNFFFFHTE